LIQQNKNSLRLCVTVALRLTLSMRVLIVGCGYVGLPAGAELARQGHEVFGVRRSRSAEHELTAVGIKPLAADVTRPETLAGLPREFDWVVNCVASSGGGPGEYRRVYLEGTGHLMEWLAPQPPQKFVYTSSTSVYGQTDGSVVEESSPAGPESETAKVLVETEKLLVAAAPEFPAVILRVAGIYGPGRGHGFRQFLSGEARLEGAGERVLNMIHRDDVVGCILAALRTGRPGEVYNAADDEPVSQRVFFEWLAAALGRPMPESVPGPDSRKRGLTSKRVSNRKLKLELGYHFRHANFREGYREEIRRLTQAGEQAGHRPSG